MALKQTLAMGAPQIAGGAFAAAPIGSTLPTDAKTVLDEAFKARGYLDEDGFKLSIDRSSNDRKAWGGVTVRRLTSEYAEKISLTLLESANADVLKMVFGEKNVEATSDKVTVKHTSADPEPMVFAFTTKDGDSLRRVVVPNGQLSLAGEVQYTHSDLITYPVEIAANVDGKGVTVYEYIEEGTTPASDAS
ncbi:phage tail protein [Arcanobacterium phocae]|uniref:phage tail tube protein n=1 Tax=Arcanobacterium phocae TaxID=131112 RepID=UPI001C0F234B|nr:phage tail protein [Arcanobacterium phocae]